MQVHDIRLVLRLLFVTFSETINNHLKPYAATTSLNLLYNGNIVATCSLAVEGQIIHGKEIPPLYQKVAVTSVKQKTKLLFKTSFDSDSEYIIVGDIIVWPLALLKD